MASLQKKATTLAPVLAKVGKDELLDSIQPVANFEGVPPPMAITGGVCYYCFTPEGGKLFCKKKHMTCVRCKAVKYCSKECQKKDWPRHKGICGVLNKFETSMLLRQLVTLQLMDAPFDDQEQLDAALSKLVHMQIDIASQLLKRPLNAAESNLISLRPRCANCGKTDAILRIKAGMNKTPVKVLRRCEDCGLAWACCTEHWDAVKERHQFHVVPAVRGDLSECAINNMLQSDVIHYIAVQLSQRRGGPGGGSPQVWFPPRHKKVYQVLNDENYDWYSELQPHIPFPVMVENFLRAFTVGLSMPYTIMSALEALHGSTSWTLKQTMTVHVLGAYQYENAYSTVFEELLHRLPCLKKLKVYFIGPQMEELSTWGANGKETSEEVCTLCQKAQKRMFHTSVGKTYHDFVKARGAQYHSPDIVAAFNAPLAFDKDRENLWGPTVKYLVDHHIPSLFTSYNEEDARADIDVLQEAGANIPEDLGPVENEWQSLQYKKEPTKSGSYYAINGWITGIFC